MSCEHSQAAADHVLHWPDLAKPWDDWLPQLVGTQQHLPPLPRAANLAPHWSTPMARVAGEVGVRG